MKQIPLYFNQLYSLEGKLPTYGVDILVRVAIEGRCVFVDDETGELGARYWVTGVNPGGVVGSGDSEQEAKTDFFDVMGSAIEGMATAAGNQEEFVRFVQEFVAETDLAELKDWMALRQQVRTGQLTESGLRQEKAERISRALVEVFYSQVDLEKIPAANDAFPAEFKITASTVLKEAA